MRDNTVTIKKGGTLEYCTHEYNEEYESREKVVVDVTDNVQRFLFNECSIEDGATLKDLFTIIEEHTELFEIIIPHYVQEFIAESKEKIEGKPAFNNNSQLEVYWSNEHDNYDGVNELVSFISFHAISAKDELPSALDFVPVNHFIDLPVILNTDFKVYGRIGYPNGDPTVFEFGSKTFNLIEIVRAIFYELSFYGSPSRRGENMTAISRIARREISE